jgi:hypothetical protein
MEANAMSLVEDYARRPKVYFKTIDFARFEPFRLAERFSEASPDYPLAYVVGASIRVNIA